MRYSILKVQFLLILLILLTVQVANAQRFGNVVERSLYADKQAFSEGDIVTVLLVEFTEGSNETNTNTNADNRLTTDATATGAMGDWGVNSFGLNSQLRNQSDSKGATTSKGKLSGKLTAVVLEVQDNGLLNIQGERMVNVNGEKQMMTLSGIIRPEDVSAGNTIYSYSIANAQISYKGEGMVTTAGKPGIFTKLWNWIF